MRLRQVLATACFYVLLTSAAWAQTVGASLQGTVTDPSQAVIAGAAVEVRNIETGAVRSLKTDGGGRWRDPVLPPGEYELRVSAPGFRTVIRQGLHLDVGQDATIDLRLEVSKTLTEVSVVADAERVNLTSG